jgi:hypothetical protein
LSRTTSAARPSVPASEPDGGGDRSERGEDAYVVAIRAEEGAIGLDEIGAEIRQVIASDVFGPSALMPTALPVTAFSDRVTSAYEFGEALVTTLIP